MPVLYRRFSLFSSSVSPAGDQHSIIQSSSFSAFSVRSSSLPLPESPLHRLHLSLKARFDPLTGTPETVTQADPNSDFNSERLTLDSLKARFSTLSTYLAIGALVLVLALFSAVGGWYYRRWRRRRRLGLDDPELKAEEGGGIERNWYRVGERWRRSDITAQSAHTGAKGGSARSEVKSKEQGSGTEECAENEEVEVKVVYKKDTEGDKNMVGSMDLQTADTTACDPDRGARQ